MKLSPSVQLYNLSALFTGDPEATYPAMIRVDKVTISVASGLIGVYLSSNFNAHDSPAAFFVVVGNTPRLLSVSHSLNSVAQHVAVDPGDETLNIDEFADFRKFPIYIPSGSAVSLYATAADRGSINYAIASLQICRVVP